MSLGWGLVASMSKRQKLISRSSTEAELIRAGGVLPAFLWSRYFIEVQGFKVEEAVAPRSSIIMEGYQVAIGRNIYASDSF